MATHPTVRKTPGLPHPLSRRKQLERDVEHITQEMYRRNRELAETNQTLSLLQTINSLVLDASESLSLVCERIATAVADAAGFPVVSIVTSDSGKAEDLILQGTNLAGVTTWKSMVGKHKVIHLGTLGSALSLSAPTGVLPAPLAGQDVVSEVFSTTPQAVHAFRSELPIRSTYVGRMMVRDKLVGYLLVGLYAYPDQVQATDLTLLERLIEPIGVALDSRLLLLENQHVLAQLRHTNVKLKTLDATKDEFITMASHQLRTPLTSVKGYLSMVLEGDAGKITAQQRELLTQSYVSSQRMVYLIADLLNLSRLSTGKFVIESAPVDLGEVVQGEVDQLRETAKSRSVTVVYDKPKSCTKLMLDETKIHQVVMNFLDNAVYYTRAGGTVTVAVRETATAVEYTVHDNGIGVPKRDQHKLFTKFYRAGNARQARPDGTGLGLFMAKKVIAAQGGAIIFDSVEGKGSTFGFRFSKAGHAVPVE